jgi:glycosyltransferase involved in cell wall biosynthesis
VRLGIDASNLIDGGGITHLVELLRSAKPLEFGFSEVIVWGRTTVVNQISPRPWLRVVGEPALDRNLISRTLWKTTRLDERARRARCDLLFIPGGLYSGSFPSVAMVRNLAPFDDRALQLYGLSWKRFKFLILRRVVSRSIRSSKAVIFLSRTAQSMITSVTGPLRGETQVIPHGVSPRFLGEVKPQEPLADYSSERPFRLLYVSRLEPYKHHVTLIDAVLQLRRDGFPVVLDLVGGGGPSSKEVLEKINNEDPDGVSIKYHGDVPYADLPTIYRRADAFVFASSCENLPNTLLEAMSSGLPIASSNRGVMPEVVGDAGLYFDPESQDSISKALMELLANPKRRAELAAAAKERVRTRTWEECSERTFGFLRSVASKVELSPAGSLD